MKKFIFLAFISFIFLTSCSTFNFLKISKNNKNQITHIEGSLNKNSFIKVTGKGIPPDNLENSPNGELLAERAAIIDGYRLLSEKLAGILIEAWSQNEKFTLSKDQIIAKTQTYLKGAEILNITHKNNGIVEVEMGLKVSPEFFNATN